MPTGGHGLRFSQPRLLLTCRPHGGGTVAVTLPARCERDWELTRPTARGRPR
jgi:hypothetical protein